MSISGLNLHAQLVRAMAEAGYHRAAPVVHRAAASALASRDVCVYVQRGVGETIAFVLPALQRLLTTPAAGIEVVILTSELDRAVRIEQQLREIGGSDTACCVLYGVPGLGALNQAAQREFRIVVSTPARLAAHLGRYYAQLDGVRLLVIDSADEMARGSALAELQQVVENIPAEHQTLLFADHPSNELSALSEQFLRAPDEIQAADESDPASVPCQVWPVPAHLKIRLLVSMAEEMRLRKTVVVVDDPTLSKQIVRKLRARHGRAAVLSAAHPAEQRQAVARGFAAGKHRVVVTGAEGLADLDAARVRHVISFDAPAGLDAALARMQKLPHARHYWFAAPEDETIVGALEARIGRPLARERLPNFDYDMPPPRGRNRPPAVEQAATLQQWRDRSDPRKSPAKIPLEEWRPEPLPEVWTAAESNSSQRGKPAQGRRGKPGRRKRRGGRRRRSGKPGGGRSSQKS